MDGGLMETFLYLTKGKISGVKQQNTFPNQLTSNAGEPGWTHHTSNTGEPGEPSDKTGGRMARPGQKSLLSISYDEDDCKIEK